MFTIFTVDSYDIVGWLGFILGLAAYYIVSYHKEKETWFLTAQIFNVVSAAFFIYAGEKYHFMQSIVYNYLWLFIALLSLREIWYKKRDAIKPLKGR